MKITRTSNGGTADTVRHPFRSPRRNFLRIAAGALAASAVTALMPRMIRKALATRAHRITGTIDDVDHIVIFTQENRSFDHYFGMLRGVRGFNDRMAIALPNGDLIWKQPTDTGYILPFHADTTVTRATCARAPSMNYPVDIAMWDHGLCDEWNKVRFAGLGMSYFSRSDLPFYYALADAFTVCDQYYASTLTQTNPNRLHLFSGSSGLSAGFLPALDNVEPVAGFTWPTVAETLETAGVRWRVYQQADNFDDNALALFRNFRSASASSALYRNGMARVDDVVRAFAADVAAGALPQVSWIIAPAALSEHANYHPQAGEDLTARLLAALFANPEVWSRTVFLLNYDEQGGFFDHEPPPTPPASDAEGRSTIATTGEIFEGLPLGLGFRVPMTVISPWSKGGYVCSEVFDHTSIIRFIERRFGVHCPNISPWRRAICGDLTSAFDFRTRETTWPLLPATSTYVSDANRQCNTLPEPTVPTVQSLPKQERGIRASRALPYEIHVNARVDAVSGTLWLEMINAGPAGVALSSYDLAIGTNRPRRYALASCTRLSERCGHVPPAATRYHLSVHGPNGFLRLFAGDVASVRDLAHANPEIRASNDRKNNALCLTLINRGNAVCEFSVSSNAYRADSPVKFSVRAGHTVDTLWSVSASGNWYDLSVTVDVQPAFLRRLAGRMENGYDLISDPAAA
ncbi:phosphocholine-specific phospholipase C [Paraburkholderia hospita]|uniref:phosphocholine-specific phospholipase C n=1 Tax=Paraburkholderia hospita TaxID=169430 RepID=UPI00027181FA|nr:phospholipase C, phosphocholine-specific [Paraburkholderia hospita]EUC12203.1 phospholipase C, phosphocholine-specific [Burkholderia sp. BT03]SKC55488.1 phospholipase C [Paraburkholderia hospita]